MSSTPGPTQSARPTRHRPGRRGRIIQFDGGQGDYTSTTHPLRCDSMRPGCPGSGGWWPAGAAVSRSREARRCPRGGPFAAFRSAGMWPVRWRLIEVCWSVWSAGTAIFARNLPDLSPVAGPRDRVGRARPRWRAVARSARIECPAAQATRQQASNWMVADFHPVAPRRPDEAPLYLQARWAFGEGQPGVYGLRASQSPALVDAIEQQPAQRRSGALVAQVSPRQLS